MDSTDEDIASLLNGENNVDKLDLSKGSLEVEQEIPTIQISEKKAESFKKLKAIYKLQKRMVQKNMHKAMSPISAISGYLELMKMFLQEDVDPQRLERYRSKIAEGVDELSEIVEELYEVFDEEGSQKGSSDSTGGELNSNRRAS